MRSGHSPPMWPSLPPTVSMVGPQPAKAIITAEIMTTAGQGNHADNADTADPGTTRQSYHWWHNQCWKHSQSNIAAAAVKTIATARRSNHYWPITNVYGCATAHWSNYCCYHIRWNHCHCPSKQPSLSQPVAKLKSPYAKASIACAANAEITHTVCVFDA